MRECDRTSAPWVDCSNRIMKLAGDLTRLSPAEPAGLAVRQSASLAAACLLLDEAIPARPGRVLHEQRWRAIEFDDLAGRAVPQSFAGRLDVMRLVVLVGAELNSEIEHQTHATPRSVGKSHSAPAAP